MRQPKIVGVVNLTEDSFSDGGRYLEPRSAVAHARRLRQDGADVIDLGAASSHPDACKVSAAEEIERLQPVLTPLLQDGAVLSVDSYRGETQRFALAQGVSYLNDIQGFADPALYPDLAGAKCRLIVMHSVQREGGATRGPSDALESVGSGVSARERTPESIVVRIDSFFDQRIDSLTRAGIVRDRIVLDPGLGFFLGDAPELSIRVLQSIEHFHQRWGCPILISASRKSFLGAITERAVADRGSATLAAELHAARQGASYIRTHDVRALRDGLRVQAQLEGYEGHEGRERR